MISTERFLTLLEEKELMSPKAVASLRTRLAQAKPVTAEAIAKHLVKHNYLTPAQAKRLLVADQEVAPPPKPSAGKPPVKKPVSKRPPVAPPEPATPAASPTGIGSLLDEEVPQFGNFPDAAGAGPLDDFFSDAAIAAAASGSPLAPAPSTRKGLWRFMLPKRPIRRMRDQWDSPLMLVGGGLLAFLLILGGVLLWAVMRGSGDEMLELANADYRAGSYAQAIHKYQAYLEKFPSHWRASSARVKIGLVQLRQATQVPADWTLALKVANDVLSDIAKEPDFKEAHGELAAMLPAIAEGLAADARKKPDPALADQVRRALAMTVKYAPKSLLPVSKLDEVEASLALTDREIARDGELDKTVALMQQAAKELKTADAYSAYRALLRQYPELAGSAKLDAALEAVSQTQQTLVKKVADAKAAETSDVPSDILASIALAQCQTKKKLPDLEGQVAFAAVDGAVYGLAAGDGKVLWRRFVGFDANPQAPSFPPTPLASAPGSDVLVVATGRNEVLRLQGVTGDVVWRHAIGEPFDAHPVIAGDTIFVATPSGKVILIGTGTGASTGYIQLPQPLGVASAVDERRALLYQVADHTNLFVLSWTDGVCESVLCLGHELGSITTAPVLVGDYLLVAINDGARDTVMQVLAIRKENSDPAEPWLKPVQQIRLDGHIQTPPLTDGRRLLVVTSRGDVRILELSGDAKAPLREVAKTTIRGADNLIRFALIQGGQFWVADTQLAAYDIQTARGRLASQWTAQHDSVFLQAPVAIGNAVVTVRHRQGKAGACVSAVALDNPDSLWQTELASPLAGNRLVVSDDGKAMAVTSNGSLYRIDAERTVTSVRDEPDAAVDESRLLRPISQVAELPGGMLAISSGNGSKQIGIFEAASQPPLFHWLKLPDKIACAPVSFSGGLLVAGSGGQVFLLDPRGAAPPAEPFQTRVEPGVAVDWIRPEAINNTEVVLANGNAKMYRLALEDQPKPHLATLAEASLPKPIVSSLAVLGETVYGCDVANVLTAFKLPKLTHGKEYPLGGRCTWGPSRVGKSVLLATDDDQLLCMDAQADRLWQIKLEHGPLAGPPLSLGEHFVLASVDGIIWRVDSATGKELGKVDTACPLGAGPVLLGQKMFVVGHDGTLYEVRQP